MSRSASWLEQRWRVVPAVVAAWTLLAAIPATSAWIATGRPDLATWWRIFAPMVTYYYLWALVSPAVYAIVRRWPLAGASLWRAIPAHLGLWLAFTTMTPFIVHADNWSVWLYGTRAYGYHAMGLFTYALTLMGCLALKHYRQGLEAEREAARSELRNAMLRGQLSVARIDTLRMQINPHFLFNALNSIGALIETGRGAEAYRTTELLGALLRRALEPRHQEQVRLAEELAFVECYLQIEGIRFGRDLRVVTEIDPATLDLAIPALVLQPIVENAVKHAVAVEDRRVNVFLRSRRDGGTLLLQVKDDGPGFNAGKGGRGGQGLANVRERLALLYGDTASLDCESVAGACVTLTLPAVPFTAEEDRSPALATVGKDSLVS